MQCTTTAVYLPASRLPVIYLSQCSCLQLLLLKDQHAALLLLRTGTLLRSLTFPSAIHSIRTDPGDHALYAGSGDGRIFETSLVGEVSSSEGSSEQSEAGYYSMEGHNGAVTCLAMTADATQMVSGESAFLFTQQHTCM